MRLPLNPGAVGLLLLLFLSLGPVSAASPVQPAPASATLPDYGGRESAPVVADDAVPNPLAQMGRAVEALVIVVVGIVGVVYALKRFGLVKPGENGKPARLAFGNLGANRAARSGAGAGSGPPVVVLSSQALPGGAMLHVVSVAGRSLLLGATPQSVSALTEWREDEDVSENAESFEEFLSRADPAAPGGGIAAANARLRSLMARPSSDENL